MARTKKLVAPVTLFAAIEQDQHEALRRLAFEQRRSLADVTRDALADYLARHAGALKAGKSRRRTASR
ncbi:MAG TPA: hypothetical protein VGA37_02500 [Gemmatimonadales bacterium]